MFSPNQGFGVGVCEKLVFAKNAKKNTNTDEDTNALSDVWRGPHCGPQTRQCDTLSLRLRHIAGTHVATTDNLSVLVFFFVFLFEFTFFCAKFRFGVDAG